jgi:hypothetical protein
MFKCHFLVYLPIVQKNGENNPLSFRIAEFDFDPGLAIGSEVTLQDVSLTSSYRNGKRVVDSFSTPKFRFKALVTDRKYLIRQENDNNIVTDKLVLNVILEIADKDIIPEMVEQLISTFPDDYEKQLISND